LAIDPLDHEKMPDRGQAKGWNITQVLNTHEHRDHTGGNDQVIAATRANTAWRMPAPMDRIAASTAASRPATRSKSGKTVELECLDTPGHTMSHICVLAHGDKGGVVLPANAVSTRRRQLP